MNISTLNANASLESLWEDLVYTEARLVEDPKAKDLAPKVSELLERLEALRRGQWNAWRQEILAQAAIDAADDALDDVTATLAETLLKAGRAGKDDAVFRRYFGADRPNEVIRLGLESQLARMRGWPASLATETKPELTALAPKLEQAMAAGAAAVSGRVSAAAARADHRAREIMRFIDDANALRLSLFGVLIGRVEEHALAREWPTRFFKRRERSGKKTAAA